MNNKHRISSITINLMCMLLLAMYATGCSDSPFNPTDGENPPPDGPTTTFGLVEVIFKNIGTDHMTAIAQPAYGNTAFALTRPSGSGGAKEGTIQIESISHGSFTTGSRGEGMRYLYATFKVRNADMDGNPYPSALQNLTFVAVDTDASAEAPETYGVTPISELRFYDGTLLTGTTAENIAMATIPTGRVAHDPTVLKGYRPYKTDVLQVFTEAEVAAITVPTGVSAFPYGFITRSPNTTPGSRELPSGPGTNQFEGIVTFAYKMPLQAQANQDPFEIKALFLPVEDSKERITQSLQEQNEAGLGLLQRRVNQLNPDVVTIFPGSGYQGTFRMICDSVRIAGSVGSATFLFHEPPTLAVLNPDAYATNGSAGHIPKTQAFTAQFSGPVHEASATNYVVRGSQSGIQFLGEAYNDNGNTKTTTPAGNFFPGEQVSVTLTPALGICPGVVAHYRVETGSSTGNFTLDTSATVGDSPNSITAGDWNGDGDLDLAVVTGADDTVSLLENDGNGNFTEKTMSVGIFPNSVTAGDWDGDGDLDLAFANSDDDNVSLLKNDGTGVFTITTSVTVGDTPASVTSGDWDADGDLDMVVANNFSANVSLLENNGYGSFTGTTVTVEDGPIEISAGDWDGDGDLDLAVANQLDDSISLMANDGTGVFTETTSVPVGNDTQSITTGDWDGDGDLDLAAANGADDTVSLLENDANGNFTETTVSVGNFPNSVTAGDWDGDGDLDLAAVNFFDDTVSLLENDGFGDFTEITEGVGAYPVSVTAGDWDGDGDLDLAIVNLADATVSLLTNQ